MFLCFSRSHFVILTLQTHPAGLVRQPHCVIPGVSLFLLFLPWFQGPLGLFPTTLVGEHCVGTRVCAGSSLSTLTASGGSKPQAPLSWSVAPGLGARLLGA